MGSINVNGESREIANDDLSTPLLWYLRDELNLTGTKYGCGMARCGACTVHIDGVAIRSCVTPVAEALNKNVRTIEGVQEGKSAVQTAWRELSVPQCGYCQSGQMMSAIALLQKKARPTTEEVNTAMGGNLCRCGTYCSIRKAINRASTLVTDEGMKP